MQTTSKLSRLNWLEGLLYAFQLIFGFSGVALAVVYGKLLLAVVFVAFLMACFFRFRNRARNPSKH
jgi:hypothetical protein